MSSYVCIDANAVSKAFKLYINTILYDPNTNSNENLESKIATMLGNQMSIFTADIHVAHFVFVTSYTHLVLPAGRETTEQEKSKTGYLKITITELLHSLFCAIL